MRKLISSLAALSLAALCVALQGASQESGAKPAAAKLVGEWTLTTDTPHGAVEGPLQLKQDGDAVTGTFTAQPFGTLPVTATLDGDKVALVLRVAAADLDFKLSGTLDGKNMSGTTEMGGNWKAARK
jgi:hypothetical protein